MDKHSLTERYNVKARSFYKKKLHRSGQFSLEEAQLIFQQTKFSAKKTYFMLKHILPKMYMWHKLKMHALVRSLGSCLLPQLLGGRGKKSMCL